MDTQLRKKYISSILIITIANALAGGMFVLAYFLSQNSVFLWGGLSVLVLTLVALVFVFVKILKDKNK